MAPLLADLQEFPEGDLERLGIRALVTKPWEDGKLKATIRRALAHPAEGDSQFKVD